MRCLDIYPTLCDLLGYEVPEGLQGRSLVPLIHGRETTAAPEVFSEHREDPLLRRIGHGSGVLVSVQSGRWKLILNEVGSQFFQRPRFELFDLEADPRESKNVADAHPDVVERLEARIARFIADHRRGAPGSDEVAMDPEVLEQLRKLGYVEGEEDEPDIWEAMASGDPAQVRRSLKAGADANELDRILGVSPLAMAAMTGNVELALVLLEGGAKVDVRGKDGSTPLIGAAFLGHPELLELLLERGADPRARNANGDTVLAVTKAPWDITEFMAGILQIDVDRAEVEAGREVCADLLMASIEKLGSEPAPPLFEAIRAGDVEAVERCLADGAGLEDRNPADGSTPLSTAAYLGAEGVARLLLEKGAEVGTRNQDGSSPLHAAALMGHASIVELLAEHGGDVDVRDAKGATPLHIAAFLGRVEVAASLLKVSADWTLRDNGGQTALDVTRTDWETTEFVIRLLGLDLERAEVEENRSEVARLLGE